MSRGDGQRGCGAEGERDSERRESAMRCWDTGLEG